MHSGYKNKIGENSHVDSLDELDETLHLQLVQGLRVLQNLHFVERERGFEALDLARQKV